MSTLPATVTIPTDDYLDLVEQALTLNALWAAGVDNWDGYDMFDRDEVRTGVEAAKAKLVEFPDLATAEARIAAHESEIAHLREVGIRLHADAGISGSDAIKWLTDHGMTDTAARHLCAAVVMEHRAARAGTES